jgi:hypothetical protein
LVNHLFNASQQRVKASLSAHTILESPLAPAVERSSALTRPLRSVCGILPPVSLVKMPSCPTPSRRISLSYLLAFDLAVLVGTWIVHQTEYAIEFGNRFKAVMTTSAHRFYMAPEAGILAIAAILAIAFWLISVTWHAHQARAATALLPPALSRSLDRLLVPTPVTRTLTTAGALFLAQCVVYSVQENLESRTMTGALPGIAVLLGGQHLTVLPLHALAALISAVIITTLWSRVRHVTQVARLVVSLVRRFAPDVGEALPSRVPKVLSPSSSLPARSLGPRAPPFAA